MELVSNNGEATQLGGVTGRGFMPGKSGNPSGRPKGIAKAVREACGGDPTMLVEGLLGWQPFSSELGSASAADANTRTTTVTSAAISDFMCCSPLDSLRFPSLPSASWVPLVVQPQARSIEGIAPSSLRRSSQSSPHRTISAKARRACGTARR